MASKLHFKKPWASSHHDQAAQPESETSLATILKTQDDKASLLMLIAECTDTMRTNLSDTFDPEKHGRGPKLPPRPTPAGRKGEPEEQSQDGKGVEKEEEREQKDTKKRLEEISSPEMQELKVAALEHFDDWRDRVLERVGEAVNEKPSTTQQQENTSALASQEEKIGLHSEDISTADQEAISALHALHPPHTTPLVSLPYPQRILVLHSLLLLVLGLERYPSQSRILLVEITSSLGLPITVLSEDETKVAKGLLEGAKRQINADEETQKKAESSATSRRWKVGLGAVAGAALIGVTGGLAAPLLAAGVGTVMGGIGLGGTAAAAYLGALAGSAPLVGALFGAYGGRMTSKVVSQYAKEINDFAFLPVHKTSLLSDDKELHRLRVAICITGWLTKEDDIVKPWQVLSASIEGFALRWELEALMGLGNAMTTYVKSAAWTVAKKEIIQRTIFGALAAGLWPIGLVKVASMIDNPFSVAKVRSEKVGDILADALINKVQGERPVTLIGYSLGARAIYSCLVALADRKAFGLVESAVFVGGPMPSDSLAWRKMRSVVSGRLVNVYSTKDYLLGFLYRTSSLQYGIAGLQAVKDVEGVENVDVTEHLDGHTKYRYLVGKILTQIGFEDVDTSQVEKQEELMQAEEKKEEEDQARKEAEGKADGESPEELQNEVDKKNKEGTMAWVSNKMSSVRISSPVGRKGEGHETATK